MHLTWCQTQRRGFAIAPLKREGVAQESCDEVGRGQVSAACMELLSPEGILDQQLPQHDSRECHGKPWQSVEYLPLPSSLTVVGSGQRDVKLVLKVTALLWTVDSVLVVTRWDYPGAGIVSVPDWLNLCSKCLVFLRRGKAIEAIM